MRRSQAAPCDNEALARAVAPFLGRLRGGRARAQSTALPIQLDVTVVDVWNADVKSETFNAKVKVRARWVCPSEHADEAMEEGGDGLDASWKPEWFPRISVACTTDTTEEHAMFQAYRDAETVTWITGEWILTVRILEAYDLHHFPFDVQDFNIIIKVENAEMGLELKALEAVGKRGGNKPAAKGMRTWNTIANSSTPVRIEASGLELPDFRTLAERDNGTNWLERPALYRKTEENEIHIVLLYERNPSFYVINYMLLLFAITSSVIFGWAVNWQQVEDRLALDVTLLLTSVAFKQVLAGTVPPISYLTRIDAYALGSLAFLLLATAMHAIIGFLIDDCDTPGGIDECAFRSGFNMHSIRTLDAVFLWAYIGVWLTANALYVMSVRRQLWRGNQAYSLAHAKARGFVPALIEKVAVEWYEEEGQCMMKAMPVPGDDRVLLHGTELSTTPTVSGSV